MLGLPDAKDKLIAAQESEIAFLRAEVAKLTDRIVAMASPVAYQVIKRNEAPAPPEPPPLTQKRHVNGRNLEPFRPGKTDTEIHAEFRVPEAGA